MIRRRSCTRRVPSYPTRTRSSSHPPCSARSTSIRVTALRECSREISILEYSYSTPGRSARRCSILRCFALLTHGLLLVGGHVVEGSDDLFGEDALLDRQGFAQLGGGAGADDRRGDAGP